MIIARVMTAAIATTGPKPGIPDSVLVGVAVTVEIVVGASGVTVGVAVGVVVGVVAVGTETTKTENRTFPHGVLSA
jgi:hypothetical protein